MDVVGSYLLSVAILACVTFTSGRHIESRSGYCSDSQDCPSDQYCSQDFLSCFSCTEICHEGNEQWCKTNCPWFWEHVFNAPQTTTESARLSTMAVTPGIITVMTEAAHPTLPDHDLLALKIAGFVLGGLLSLALLVVGIYFGRKAFAKWRKRQGNLSATSSVSGSRPMSDRGGPIGIPEERDETLNQTELVPLTLTAGRDVTGNAVPPDAAAAAAAGGSDDDDDAEGELYSVTSSMASLGSHR